MLIRYLIIFMFWWFKCIVNRNLIRIKCYWWNNLIYKLYDLDIKLKTVYWLIKLNWKFIKKIVFFVFFVKENQKIKINKLMLYYLIMKKIKFFIIFFI